MKRQIVLDTETTGIGHEQGHRIIEIGCVEILNRKLTGNHYHVYLNPQREVDEGAFKVHGISTDFLKDKPLFKDIVHDFMKFIGHSELIIHNAAFDVGFLDNELRLIQWAKSITDYCQVTDTLLLARKKHPGQRNSLDALCKRYDIDNANRQLHGALLDAEILASVYLAMTGGQASLFAEEKSHSTTSATKSNTEYEKLTCSDIRIPLTDEEKLKHEAFIQFLVKKSGVNRFIGSEDPS